MAPNIAAFGVPCSSAGEWTIAWVPNIANRVNYCNSATENKGSRETSWVRSPQFAQNVGGITLPHTNIASVGRYLEINFLFKGELVFTVAASC